MATTQSQLNFERENAKTRFIDVQTRFLEDLASLIATFNSSIIVQQTIIAKNQDISAQLDRIEQKLDMVHSQTIKEEKVEIKTVAEALLAEESLSKYWNKTQEEKDLITEAEYLKEGEGQ